MRVIELELPKYKNLIEFSIKFDEAAADVLIVGNNGTGKSNLIEAMVIIFRDLIQDSRKKRISTDFAYSLVYLINGRKIHIDHQPGRAKKRTQCFVDGRDTNLQRFSALAPTALPRTVFAYYSGTSDRLSKLFDSSLVEFRNAMIAGDMSAKEQLIYGRSIHSNFVLLAFLIDDDPEALRVIKDELGISDMESALFVFQQPYWARAAKQNEVHKSEFWRARGVVREFLDHLYSLSLAPMQLVAKERTGIGTSVRRERLYLFIRKAEELRRVVDELRSRVGVDEPRSRTLFRLLESAFVSDLIKDISITIRKKNVAEPISFQELSEGEQQLLMVLGLLRFTRNEESLFLLDEPDTHINPVWGMRFLQLIKRVVGADSTRHLLLITHDPVAVAAVKKEEVRLLARDSSGRVHAISPDDDPEKLGIPGVLISDLFGLSSVMSPEIEKDIDRRHELVALDTKRSGDEDRELQQIAERLEDVDLSATAPDPLYARFLKMLIQKERDLLRSEAQLPLDEQTRREEIMSGVLDDVLDGLREE